MPVRVRLATVVTCRPTAVTAFSGSWGTVCRAAVACSAFSMTAGRVAFLPFFFPAFFFSAFLLAFLSALFFSAFLPAFFCLVFAIVSRFRGSCPPARCPHGRGKEAEERV